jgi:hypothetical protein
MPFVEVATNDRLRETDDRAQLPPVGAELVLTTSLDLVGSFHPSAALPDPSDITRFPVLEAGTRGRILAYENDRRGDRHVVVEIRVGRFETLRVWVSTRDALSAWTGVSE